MSREWKGRDRFSSSAGTWDTTTAAALWSWDPSYRKDEATVVVPSGATNFSDDPLSAAPARLEELQLIATADQLAGSSFAGIPGGESELTILSGSGSNVLTDADFAGFSAFESLELEAGDGSGFSVTFGVNSYAAGIEEVDGSALADVLDFTDFDGGFSSALYGSEEEDGDDDDDEEDDEEDGRGDSDDEDDDSCVLDVDAGRGADEIIGSSLTPTCYSFDKGDGGGVLDEVIEDVNGATTLLFSGAIDQIVNFNESKDRLCFEDDDDDSFDDLDELDEYSPSRLKGRIDYTLRGTWDAVDNSFTSSDTGTDVLVMYCPRSGDLDRQVGSANFLVLADPVLVA